MAQLIVFHHARGLTAGVLEFAEQIRRSGHSVHVPDLFEGRTFDDLEAGVAYAREVGFGTIAERAQVAANTVPYEAVYAGFSLGVLPAQKLAQTRQGAAGALLFDACVPIAEFGGHWPQDVPIQIHAMEADKWFVGSGDFDAARELIASARNGELFLYPGDRHLFVDSSLPSYDEAAAALVMERVLLFLDAIR